MGECKLSLIVHDVEEGEISDSASSVEEISEEAFNNNNNIKPQPPPTSSAAAAAAASECTPPVSANDINDTNSNHPNNNHQMMWSMRDLYKYSNQLSRNYSPGLYNLAWASAVQNKPLDEFLVMEYPKAENGGLKQDGIGSEVPVAPVTSNNASSATADENPEDNDAVIEVNGEGKVEEREEGELEEGEIDFDSDMVIEVNDDLSDEVKEDKKESDLDQTLDLIRKGLESVTAEEAEKSLDQVSSRIQNLLGNMEEMAKKNLLTAKDVIATLAFSAIKTLNAAFCSMNPIQKECNKEMMSRLLALASNLSCGLFSDQQFKEIEVMISALDSSSIPLGSKNEHRKVMEELEILAKSDFDFASRIMKKVSKDVVDLDANSVITSDQLQPRTSEENIKLANSKWRGLALPLLDLHKDHDADSLPSPTRGEPSCLPCVLLKPEWPVPRVVLDRDGVPMHPYETDAVKAVSSYQQKFGRSSFLMTDRLPSPTPSEDGDAGDGDVSGEVSSSSNMIVDPVNTLMVDSTTITSAPKMDISSGQGLTNAWNGSLASYGLNPLVKSSSAKSRDPRLRLANSDASASSYVLPVVNHEHKVESVGGVTNSRKQKTAEELVSEGPALKRQRAERAEIRNDVQGVTGNGGWLENRGMAGIAATSKSHELISSGNDPRRRPEFTVPGSSSSIANITVNSTANLPATTPSVTASYHSLLKDIVVNPSIWMNILTMEHQKSANLAQTATQPVLLNPGTGTAPSTNMIASRPHVLGEKAAGVLQTTPQISSVEEMGKMRMKPRDPRRVLHSSTVPKGGNTELKQSLSKTSTPSTPGMMASMNLQRQDDLLDNKSTPSHCAAPPDIARQFTKNLKNIADIVSVSQTTAPEPVIPKVTSSPHVEAHQVRTDAVAKSESGNPQNVCGRDIKASVVSSQTPNDWHDVEHLFEGFDAKQKVAIHRERARRLEEQRKLFAERKLCLVLDLDHTLLNSAKFTEVDSAHDEMLRKKEELDREKSHRHLFRFPHMGMWTKLRPGVWNFLEKASRLFELHLYTMGNKLYATEMAKLLDPKGELFAGRVISRGDDSDLLDGDERVPKIKDLEGVMGMESSVVIVDDSLRVWPHNKLNLIVVERYIYFPCSRRQFGLPGPSLLEIDHDERPEDGSLASSLAVIERIHEIFFSHESLDEADVRNILALVQRKILAGCRILFSRVFPVGEANPHLHPLWQTAEQFGAVCTNSIDENVTHVVANSLGTDKVNWALSTGRFVVHPGWVEASALLYRRANEVDFAIKP